ncbi:TPA: DedA family protein [Candidatus Woesearchaeota archaeon]|nr:DedA family protein [Candidatus Woesearchaeota archaeon]HIH31973.1 DedA family protein [Candidatus Woesearchaeota archaeon]HIH54490.1 DedA family protein [Candidatus Woesearchaeota archaeon]HIJ02109.1 DedA family protein [Candidatus Woesearchaeota archaeon]HIJ13157.1 DedA family protein [Candidatus Woesearchaeota archaeon]
MHRLHRIVLHTKERIKKIDYSKLYDAGIGFWVLVLLIFVTVVLFLVYIKQAVSVFVSDYGYIGIFIVAFVSDLLVQPIGPDLPLALGILSGLNPWIVFAMVCIGSYLALVAAYYVGKTLGAAGIEKVMGKKNFAKLSKYETGSKWFMFIGALTPVPYIPYFAGLWNFSFVDTLIFVVVPRTLRFFIGLILVYYIGITLV